jgi:CubicO group peptidase (beta-lactamase class C family)
MILSALALTLALQRPAAWPAFTRTVDDYVARDSIVGASVLIVRDGRVVAQHEVGWANRAAGWRTDTNTIYHWASITKTLTAIAILQLRDRGRLSLDDPITRWVPELRQVHDSFGAIDHVTLRMLLGHSAGFQNPTWPYGQGKPWEPFEPVRWDQLVAMMPYQELLFRPDTKYSYSNPGFIYLARVIEALSGDPWETYVQKNILTPLGLTRSYFGATPYHQARWRAHNYFVEADSSGHESVIDAGADFDPGITIPNGGWNAPLGDLATYLAFLTTGARGDTVLAHASLEEMWRSRFPAVEPVAGMGTPTDSIGLSFFVLWRGGTRFVGHTGHQAGFRSFFYINPATRTGIVAAFNTTNDAHNDISEAGFRAVIDSALTLIAK